MDKPSGSGYGVPTEEPHHAGSLAPTAPTLYCPTSQRKRNDNVCTGLFLVFMAFSVLGGIGMMAAGSKSDDTAELRTPAYYNRSLTCDVKSFQSAYTNLYPTGSPTPSPSGSSGTDESDNNTGVDRSLAIGIAIWLPITIVVGIPTSLLYLHLFKKWPMLMVKISLFGTLGLLGIMTIITFATGAWPLGIIMLIFTAVLGLLILWVRKQLPLCAELLGVASHALMENLRIISTSLGITFVSMGILVFLIVAIVLANNVGKAQVNGLVTNRVPVAGSNNEIGYCYDNMNRQVPCCVWTVDGFPTLYIFISAITIMWTTFVIMQIKLHVIADVIAQWYYQPVGAFTNTKEAPSVRLAVRHALTTGFGTTVFAGAILFIISMIRSALRQEGRKNLLCAVINCFAQPILALLEKFTQFATIAAAITGKPFIDAAKDMFEALKRCLFKTDSVWWVPNLVIGMVVYAMSLVWAALPFMAVAAESKNWGVGFAVAIFSFILMVIILNLSAGILMDIVNTLYCLYALDRDTKVITRPEVHNIYNQVVALTCPDAVVQNPGGEIAYGRAEEGHAPPVYPATNPPGYYHPERDTQPLMTQPPQPLYVGHPVVYNTNYPPPHYPGYTSSAPAPRY